MFNLNASQESAAGHIHSVKKKSLLPKPKEMIDDFEVVESFWLKLGRCDEQGNNFSVLDNVLSLWDFECWCFFTSLKT